jgi:5-methylcytosine-specific restriction endonuclease McrA
MNEFDWLGIQDPPIRGTHQVAMVEHQQTACGYLVEEHLSQRNVGAPARPGPTYEAHHHLVASQTGYHQFGSDRHSFDIHR